MVRQCNLRRNKMIQARNAYQRRVSISVALVRSAATLLFEDLSCASEVVLRTSGVERALKVELVEGLSVGRGAVGVVRARGMVVAVVVAVIVIGRHFAKAKKDLAFIKKWPREVMRNDGITA